METNNQHRTGERNERTGRYQTMHADEDFIEAVRAGDQPSTPEIADALGCAKRTALVRLNELADEGRVKKRKVGAVNLWRPVDGSEV
jgi:predicted ArsR family transcriptional regulator